jgi:hypothetical protein
MRNLFIVLLAIGCAFPALSQKSRKFNGKSRKDFFGGAEDYRDITKNGLQISFGPTYTLTRNRIKEVEGVDENNRGNTSYIDPSGRLGGFIDIGMAHYILKPNGFLAARQAKRKDADKRSFIGSNLIHRIDWGLGFSYIGGKEYTKIDFQDALGNYAYSTEGEGKFYNGYLYGRVTADRFTKIADSWHLETGLGLNFNYCILEGSRDYSSAVYAEQKFQKNFLSQLHGHLGFNYKIRRGDYFIMGFYLPLIGIYEPNKLKPTIQWYSSNYYPASLQFKWIHHFTKKSNGCNTGTDADRKKNEEYMQNR